MAISVQSKQIQQPPHRDWRVMQLMTLFYHAHVIKDHEHFVEAHLTRKTEYILNAFHRQLGLQNVLDLRFVGNYRLNW
jgi:hypothetical protein